MQKDLDPMPPAEGRELLLVGGGHAHLGLLRSLAMRRIPGLRVTLVADELAPIYSGMAVSYTHLTLPTNSLV